MRIRNAQETDFEIVRTITRETISAIYPHYYPRGAVDFFLAHHSDEQIAADIRAGIVYLYETETGTAIGTVTVRDQEIARLFVLPQAQGKGIGTALMDFAEELIFRRYDAAELDCSFAAKSLYRKRGYTETSYQRIQTENGDYLCFDVMVKPNQKGTNQ